MNLKQMELVMQEMWDLSKLREDGLYLRILMILSTQMP